MAVEVKFDDCPASIGFGDALTVGAVKSLLTVNEAEVVDDTPLESVTFRFKVYELGVFDVTVQVEFEEPHPDTIVTPEGMVQL